MYLVGSRVVTDMLDMVGNFDFSAIKSLIDVFQILLVPAALVPIAYKFYVTKFTTLKEDDPDKYHKVYSMVLMISQIGVFSIMFLIVTGGGIWLASQGIGWIRAFAPLLVLICLGVTVVFHPNRLLNTAGVVIAFVLSSVGWEFALFVVEVIENAPSST